MADSSLNRWKTLWEKEKLLFMSNFSFFHSVFKRLVQETRKNQGLFGKGLQQCFSSFSRKLCFTDSLDERKVLLVAIWFSGNLVLWVVYPLTFYHTIPTFNDPYRESLLKHCEKKRKCW